MTILIDCAAIPLRGKIYYHMMTDGPIEELHAFAAKLGLKACWFQPDLHHPHYDVSASKRRQAIELGAEVVTTKTLLRRCAPKKEPTPCPK